MIDHILLDMDGVLVDFFRAALRKHNAEHLVYGWPPGEWFMERVLGISDKAFWAPIDADPSFWMSLSGYQDWRKLYAACCAYAPTTIATTPSHHPHSAYGKVVWLQKHLGEDFRSYMLGPQKHLLATPTRLLIDDRDENCERFEKAGGKALLVPRPWNSRHAEYDLGDALIYEELSALFDG